MFLKHSVLATTAAATVLLFAAGSAHADDMSDMADWCTKATAPSSMVICSDPELRRQAVIRNRIFADARETLSEEEMKELTADQNHWIHEYTAACGASVNGSPVSLPVPQDITDCYKQAGRERIAELVRGLRDAIPNYQVPTIGGGSATSAPQPSVSSSDRDEREQAAEDARRRLQAQAAQDQLKRKLEDLSFRLLLPVDLDLDWKALMTTNTKVAVRGTYVEANDVEVLSTPDDKDQPTIRLYTNDSSRAARKVMLECHNSNFALSSCEMVVGATIQSCIRNKGELNEKEVPCLRVQEAYVIP